MHWQKRQNIKTRTAIRTFWLGRKQEKQYKKNGENRTTEENVETTEQQEKIVENM